MICHEGTKTQRHKDIIFYVFFRALVSLWQKEKNFDGKSTKIIIKALNAMMKRLDHLACP